MKAVVFAKTDDLRVVEIEKPTPQPDQVLIKVAYCGICATDYDNFRGFTSFAKNGDAGFVTYRDPNLRNSIDVFEKASEYLRNFEADDRTILQYIIGAISDLDTPKTPSAKGSYGLTAYLCNAKMENIQKNRDELLAADKEAIRKLADYVDAFMSDECLCVIGSAEKIDECSDIFESVQQLVNR